MFTPKKQRGLLVIIARSDGRVPQPIILSHCFDINSFAVIRIRILGDGMVPWIIIFCHTNTSREGWAGCSDNYSRSFLALRLFFEGRVGGSSDNYFNLFCAIESGFEGLEGSSNNLFSHDIDMGPGAWASVSVCVHVLFYLTKSFFVFV